MISGCILRMVEKPIKIRANKLYAKTRERRMRFLNNKEKRLESLQKLGEKQKSQKFDKPLMFVLQFANLLLATRHLNSTYKWQGQRKTSWSFWVVKCS
jgi:hypothetical protein